MRHERERVFQAAQNGLPVARVQQNNTFCRGLQKKQQLFLPAPPLSG
jgi:hypothetical protein